MKLTPTQGRAEPPLPGGLIVGHPYATQVRTKSVTWRQTVPWVHTGRPKKQVLSWLESTPKATPIKPSQALTLH